MSHRVTSIAARAREENGAIDCDYVTNKDSSSGNKSIERHTWRHAVTAQDVWPLAMGWSHGSTRWVGAEGTVPARQTNAVRQRTACASSEDFPDRFFLFRLLFRTEGAPTLRSHRCARWLAITQQLPVCHRTPMKEIGQLGGSGPNPYNLAAVDRTGSRVFARGEIEVGG